MLNAMLTYRFKSQTSKQNITFFGEKIEYKALRKEIASKTGIKQQELILYDQSTNTRLKDGDYIKAYSSIIVERCNPLMFIPPVQVEVKTNSAEQKNINNHQLDGMLNNAKYFMIKSSNQVNIQRAKDQSVWATTMVNQRKLKAAYDESPHIILFFKASNSNNLYGVARMEQKPSDIANKNVWIGVQTIKLGGNFKIRWISKNILSGSKYQQEVNPITKQYVNRSVDMTQIQKDLGRRMVYMFDIPQDQQISFITPPVEEKIIDINQILKAPPTIPSLSAPGMISNYNPYGYLNMNFQSLPAGIIPTEFYQKNTKQKKIKKQRRSYSSSSSSSSDSSRSRSRDSRRKQRRSRKDKKDRKEKQRRKRSDSRDKKKKSKSDRNRQRSKKYRR